MNILGDDMQNWAKWIIGVGGLFIVLDIMIAIGIILIWRYW
jgi:hypothetical protein